MIKKIFLDMDGVLADFDEGFNRLHGVLPSSLKKTSTQEFWDLVHDLYPRIYADLPLMEGAITLLEFVDSLDIPKEYLTAVPRMRDIKYAAHDKQNWLANYLPKYNYKFNIGPWSQDKQYWSKPGYVLIDDRKRNIEQWNDKGGIGILYRDVNDTIFQLQRLL